MKAMLSRLMDRLPIPKFGQPELPPERLPLRLDRDSGSRMLDLVMHEYDAIRSEVDNSLSNQVAILSFGAATVGLLVAAAGTLWNDERWLAGVLLLVVVPIACFLTRAIHAGELVRLMRAGLFLHELENWVNAADWPNKPARGRVGVLRWEQWGIREKEADVDHHIASEVSLVFGIMAYGFMLFGFVRLHNIPPLPEPLAVLALVAALTISLPASVWVRRLNAFAYRHRLAYTRPELAGSRDPAGVRRGP